VVEANAGVVDVYVELGQAPPQQPPRRADRVEATLTGLEGHETSVGLLGLAVERNDLLQHLAGGVGSSGLLLELSQAEMGVDGAAMPVPADRLDPQIAHAGQRDHSGNPRSHPRSAMAASPLNHPVVPAAEVAITPTRPLSRLINASA
jgi:hypothetical protein